MIIENFDKKEKVTSPDKIYNIFKAILEKEKEENNIDFDKEHVWTIGLKSNNTIKYIELVSLGNLNSSIVHPREIYRFAIMQAVSSLILVHNHPSGEAYPSKEDIELTKLLVKAGKILGINLIDHVILSETSYLSFCQFVDLNEVQESPDFSKLLKLIAKQEKEKKDDFTTN